MPPNPLPPAGHDLDGAIAHGYRTALKQRLTARYATTYGQEPSRFRRWVPAAPRLAVLVVVAAIVVFRGGLPSTYARAQHAIDQFANRIELRAHADAPTEPQQEAYAQQDTAVRRDQLAAMIDFPLATPAYLPPGYAIEETYVVSSPVEGIKAKVGYGQRRSFWLEQSKPPVPMVLSVDPARGAEQVDINGHTGVLYNPAAGQGGTPAPAYTPGLMLQWTDGVYWFELHGRLTREELVKIARSVR